MDVSRQPLDVSQIHQRLAALGGWRFEDGRLRKTFEFENFVEAFGWMTKVALEAERLDHHPNWSNVYQTVKVELWTHDADAITEVDFALAGAMDRHRGS